MSCIATVAAIEPGTDDPQAMEMVRIRSERSGG
jgi:hypothetical protein